MPEPNFITITMNYKRMELDVRMIQYVFIDHDISDRVYAASETHTDSTYHVRFQSFDDLPIAFCDIFQHLSQHGEKWLKSYECAAFYSQTLEIIDCSLEIDTDLEHHLIPHHERARRLHSAECGRNAIRRKSGGSAECAAAVSV